MMNRKINSSILHVLGCLAFLSLPVLFSPDFSTSFEFVQIRPFQREFFTYVLLLVFFYINYYLLIPKLYFEKKYFLFFSLIFILYLVINGIPELLFPKGPPPMRSFMDRPFHEPPHRMSGNYFMKYARTFLPFVSITVISLLFKVYSRWKQAEQEKTSTELSYLKAQINPHFLFNSLNSIYSLTIDEQASRSSEAVIKLSNMMRYVLVESQQEFVSLEKEINYITNYIELQKIRFGEIVNIKYTVPSDLNGVKIAPLLLIPFIENAFKYGVNPEKHSIIDMEISVREKQLYFTSRNQKVRSNISDSEKQGIGINNTVNRLKIIYPGKHELIIREDKDNYFVSLKIDLR